VVEPGVERASRVHPAGGARVMDPILREVRGRAPGRVDRQSTSYHLARCKDEAVGAAACAASWLEELALMDLGHEGDHAVAEALRNVRAVLGFLRRRERNGG
jgi:hypothetical protein